jgi:hypothetical protein
VCTRGLKLVGGLFLSFSKVFFKLQQGSVLLSSKLLRSTLCGLVAAEHSPIAGVRAVSVWSGWAWSIPVCLSTSRPRPVSVFRGSSSLWQELVPWIRGGLHPVPIIIATQERVVNGERRHAEPPGGNDHPQFLLVHPLSIVSASLSCFRTEPCVWCCRCQV